MMMASPRSHQPKSASGSGTSAPDEQVAGFVSGNDPTDGSLWIRRTIYFEGSPSETAIAEALDALLDLPGIARARPSGEAAITVDMRPDVLSDQELQDAFARAALDVDTWDDTPAPSEASSVEGTDVHRLS
jgi:hypothetical protein